MFVVVLCLSLLDTMTPLFFLPTYAVSRGVSCLHRLHQRSPERGHIPRRLLR